MFVAGLRLQGQAHREAQQDPVARLRGTAGFKAGDAQNENETGHISAVDDGSGQRVALG